MPTLTLLSTLSDHFCGQREAMTKAWLTALWKSPESGKQGSIQSPQLVNHLPRFFDEVADSLRGDGEPQAEHDAQVRGNYRWEQHFRLDQVLREVLLLRSLIMAEIESYLSEHEPSATVALLEARRRVARFFDEVLLDSATQFSEQQQAQIQEARRLLTTRHQVAESDMRALDAARLRLLRTIAHELRNMLNAAVLMSENLFAEEDPACCGELQEMLRRNHQQMTALVNQLLEMAPLLAREEALRLAPLNMRAFAAAQHKLFERMAASKRLKFRCELAEAPAEIITDELKLQRIVTNLVQNALKYTPPGGSIELRFESLDPERWRLSVSDSGPGIPEEHRTSIFEEFHRVPGTERQEGTGLGLSIVRELVRLFYGDIAVESEVGRGTTFCVTLPRDATKRPNLTPDECPPAVEVKASVATTSRNPELHARSPRIR